MPFTRCQSLADLKPTKTLKPGNRPLMFTPEPASLVHREHPEPEVGYVQRGRETGGVGMSGFRRKHQTANACSDRGDHVAEQTASFAKRLWRQFWYWFIDDGVRG